MLSMPPPCISTLCFCVYCPGHPVCIVIRSALSLSLSLSPPPLSLSQSPEKCRRVLGDHRHCSRGSLASKLHVYCLPDSVRRPGDRRRAVWWDLRCLSQQGGDWEGGVPAPANMFYFSLSLSLSLLSLSLSLSLSGCVFACLCVTYVLAGAGTCRTSSTAVGSSATRRHFSGD